MMRGNLKYAQCNLRFREECLEIAKEYYREVFKKTRKGDTKRRTAIGIIMECEFELEIAKIRLNAIQMRIEIIGR